MAKKGNRKDIGLECSVCKNHNYITSKNTMEMKEKINLNKYCKKCMKVTSHAEFKSLH